MTAGGGAVVRTRRSAGRRFLLVLARNRLAAAGLAIVVIAIVAAAAAPILPLADPNATALDARLLRPGAAGHPLGTDHLGRDMLARLVWGARLSLAVAVFATLIAAVAGSLVGLVAGFYGRWVDTALMRGIDTLMAFPYLLLALAIIAALGPGLMNALVAVAVVNIPFFARAVRGATVGEMGRDYVDAARLSGFSDARVLATEVLPNVLPTVVIAMATTFGWMILETAGLSFLGLGAQPPRADLGSMLGEGRKLFIVAPHVATVPGLAILVVVVGINLLADGVRDLLDPRLGGAAPARPGAVTAVAEPRPRQPDEHAEAAAEPGVVLAVRDLSTWFDGEGGPVRAVDGVSFDVRAGECLGIVGESGSGKTVAALSILGLVPTPPGRIAGGAVRFQGRDLVGAPLADLQNIRGNRIAYVSQDPAAALNPLMPVGAQVAEAVARHQAVSPAAARRRALELLEQVRLPEPRLRVRAYPHELSGGMQQRAVIAMALANDPDLLIADEPTTALDVTTQAEILRLIDALRRERAMALLFISHDFGVVYEVADRVLVMRHGQVVESGAVEAVFRSPRAAYTRRLLDSMPRLGEPERVFRAPREA